MSNKLNLYTFCVDIGKHSKKILEFVLNIMLKSLHKYVSNYNFICYTNFKLSENIIKKYNIIQRKYYDKSDIRLYNDKWKNLSFNKINIYKDLYDEFKEDYTWIDLDTIICTDISYINKYSNIFIDNGGKTQRNNLLFENNNNITIPRNKYIQGNFWKLNISLYNEFMETLKDITEKGLKLRYDLQDLFGYHIYIKHKDKCPEINILGRNTKNNSLYGLCVWKENGEGHASKYGLNNMYIESDKLKSRFYKDKDIDIVSFTFNTLKILFNEQKFKELFD